MDPRQTIKTLKRDLEDKRFENSLFVRLCGVPMSANEARLVIDLMTEIAEIDFPETAGTESPSDKRAAHAYTLSCLTREMNINVEARQEIARLKDVLRTTRGNIVSLRDAGMPGPLEEWLRVVDETLSLQPST